MSNSDKKLENIKKIQEGLTQGVVDGEWVNEVVCHYCIKTDVYTVISKDDWFDIKPSRLYGIRDLFKYGAING